MSGEVSPHAVAIIGLAGRFPGAGDLAALWRNLRDGVESVRTFSLEELARAGVPPEVSSDPRFVPAGAPLDDVELFDAPLFGLSAREAEIMDPQHRLFLECAWLALEDAGYDSSRFGGSIGVFASTMMSSYLMANLYPHRHLLDTVGWLTVRILNDKDFLATRASYKLDLRGPSMAVQSACSSSLVGCHLACTSLLGYQCDMALVGGSSINLPQTAGYLHVEGGIYSPDGHCRAFDARAAGTVTGNGVGVVVLKRLADALADGDPVRAVILGSAVNNDGALKVGYMAPSVDGQAEVVAAALALADIDPATVGYLEAHGTGTTVGDPIEIAALTQVFGGPARRKKPCAIGSVKSNFGHLDAAAGVAGLIKTVLALEHGEIPPSLHCGEPNPAIGFAGTPFRVNTRLAPWERDGVPRRAGVSSLGVGGTNAHVVLEEAPPLEPGDPTRRRWQLLTLSAHTPSALDRATESLARHLRAHLRQPLADVAYTLEVGRRRLARRRFVVCRDGEGNEDAATALEERDPRRVLTADCQPEERPLVFLFPGQGAQYPGMGREVYETEPVYREAVDRCAALLEPRLGLDLRSLLMPPAEVRPEVAAFQLQQTLFAQTALFTVEYALAQLWASWGLRPWAMIGHSIGEYVAACLAGVFSLPDALELVALRGRLMQSLPPGAMLGVSLSETDALELAGERLSLAAVNGPNLSVLSGPTAAVEEAERRCAEREVKHRRLVTSHAFHSAMLDPILGAFRERLRTLRLEPPSSPYLSNVTGTWIRPGEATDPDYWVRHLRQAVRFSSGIAELLARPRTLLLEVGPGHTLTSLARPLAIGGDHLVVASLPAAKDGGSEMERLLQAAGRLWLSGVEPDGKAFYAQERRRRVPLPGYPFDRHRYWIDPPAAGPLAAPSVETGESAESTPTLPARGQRPWLQTEYVAPASDLERSLGAIWEELLGVHPIGAYDSFFELGGHSLLATQLASRLRDRMGLEVELGNLFATPTLRELAQLVERAAAATFPLSAPPLGRESREGALPLSFAQQRLWFLDRMSPGDPAYNMPFAVRLEGELSVRSLASAFAAIVRRHEALRTAFPSELGEPRQEISPAGEVSLEVLDLTTLPADLRCDEARRLAREEAAHRFDLEGGPLWRLRLLRLEGRSHLLLLILHHIVSDAWSMGVLLRELGALYGTEVAGLPSPLPEPPIQYADYALWQRRRLSGEALDGLLAYWKGELEGAEPIEIQLDRPRPPVRAPRGALLPFALPAALADRLSAFGQAEGASLFMVLMTAFDLLLFRHGGEGDVVVGFPIANRTRSETEGVIGLFINTLALRIRPEGEGSVRDLLRQVRTRTLGAYAHQDLPFEALVDDLGAARDLSRTPVFQTMLVLQNAPLEPLDLPGLRLEPVGVEAGTAKFDLTLTLAEGTAGLSGSLEYDQTLFDAATVERLLGGFILLLEGVVDDPGRRLSEVPLLSASERAELLEAWNDTRAAVPAGCLHELVAAEAERRPEAIAVLGGAERLSYSELDRRAGIVAAELAALGVGPEERVAVCLERSPELLVALLGVLKAGAAYVPLDPESPRDRLATILEESRVRALISREPLIDRLPESPAVLVWIDRLEWSGARRPVPPPRPADPDNVAYVIFTSGSTGRPKGVMVSHRGVVNYLTWCSRAYGLGAGSRSVVHSSIAFDLTVTALFAPLLCGGAVRMLHETEGLETLSDALLAEGGFTLLKVTPAHLELLNRELSPEAAARVGTLVLGGEALLGESLGFWRQNGGETRIVNEYGPTEAVVGCCVHESGPELPPGRVPIGRPIAKARLYVLDRHLEAVPKGARAELYIGEFGDTGGAVLARGYLGRPELTAERFLPDPWSPEPGGRMYRTGDLVRHLPTLGLDYLGRNDDQVKIRGYRVELGEIESAVGRHPDVRESVVVVREDAPGDRRLAAYFVPSAPRSAQPAFAGELRGFLREILPAYMMPAHFVELEALPLTANGKVDRRALPPPDGRRSGLASAAAPPRNEAETRLAEIWATVLRLDRVGIHDNFFELGGDSILGIRVVARAHQVGVRLVPRQLFQYQTIAELAAVAERMEGAPTETEDAQPARLSDEDLSQDDLDNIFAQLES